MNCTLFCSPLAFRFALRTMVAATALVTVAVLPGSAKAVNVNVTNYSWLQLPAGDVTTVLGSQNNMVQTGFGTPNDLRWGDYVWLPTAAMTDSGNQMYYAGVRLDQSRNVSSVRLQWWTVGMDVGQYFLDGSNDGASWTNIGTGGAVSNSTSTTTLQAVTPGNYQYIRLRMEAPDYNMGGGYGGPGFALIEPIGSGPINGDKVNWANAQLGTSVTNNGFVANYTSTTHNDGTLADRAATANWTGSAGSWPNGTYTQVDLGTERLIGDAVAVWSHPYSGNDYDIEYSLNGTTFFPVTGSLLTNFGPENSIGASQMVFDPVVARYIRMSNANNTGASHTLLNQLLLHSPEDGVLDSNPGANGTIHLTSLPNQTVTLDDALELQNDGGLGTAIGIFSYDITGPDAGLFDLANFAPLVLSSGEAAQFDVEVTSVLAGNYNAVLTFSTSLGDIAFNLETSIVPEPSSALLLGLGMVGAVGQMRRRRRS